MADLLLRKNLSRMADECPPPEYTTHALSELRARLQESCSEQLGRLPEAEAYYGFEEFVTFPPPTHSAMVCQSGSSLEANCRPPPWTKSASPPANGDRG